MAEAEGGLNSRSATCYLAVAITGSNVKLVARFQTHRNIGSVHAWETVVWKEEEKEANCTRGNPWSYILYEQKETIFEELVAILHDKNEFGP